LIIEEEKPEDKLSRFCEKWNDEQDTEDIVSEIYESRKILDCLN